MPHTMKYKFLLFALVAVAFVACETRSVVSPSVRVSSSLYRTYTVQDSLGQDSLVRDTISLTDSLRIGDTVRMGMVCEGYYDYLRALTIVSDPSEVDVSLSWDEEAKHLLTSAADPEHGKLAFVADSVYACYTTLTYVPVATGTHRIGISLVSAAKDPYTEGAWHFNIAVK